MTDSADSILRLKDVKVLTGLSRSSIYARLNPRSKFSDPSFPRSISLGLRAVGFSEKEVREWIAGRIVARDAREKRDEAAKQPQPLA